jgi:hypothetical protein
VLMDREPGMIDNVALCRHSASVYRRETS